MKFLLPITQVTVWKWSKSGNKADSLLTYHELQNILYMRQEKMDELFQKHVTKVTQRWWSSSSDILMSSVPVKVSPTLSGTGFCAELKQSLMISVSSLTLVLMFVEFPLIVPPWWRIWCTQYFWSLVGLSWHHIPSFLYVNMSAYCNDGNYVTFWPSLEPVSKGSSRFISLTVEWQTVAKKNILFLFFLFFTEDRNRCWIVFFLCLHFLLVTMNSYFSVS